MNQRKDDPSLPAISSEAAIERFLARVAEIPPATGTGRLIFGLDATGSREATWDQASQIQAQMFADTQALGGLQIQLCFYRGFGEFRKSRWYTGSPPLLRAMQTVRCVTGNTQIARLLRHCVEETRTAAVQALVFVGDAMEENPDALGQLAGELGLLRVPVFVFQEGYDPVAERAFRDIARLSGGAWCRFDNRSPGQLRALLGAVAVYAAGGRKALEELGRSAPKEVRYIATQLLGKD